MAKRWTHRSARVVCAVTHRGSKSRGKLRPRTTIESEVETVKGYSDFVNGTLCFLVGAIWAAVTSQLMPEKSGDVAVIFVPFGLLAVAGACLITRFRIRNLR